MCSLWLVATCKFLSQGAFAGRTHSNMECYRDTSLAPFLRNKCEYGLHIIARLVDDDVENIAVGEGAQYQSKRPQLTR